MSPASKIIRSLAADVASLEYEKIMSFSIVGGVVPPCRFYATWDLGVFVWLLSEVNHIGKVVFH